MANKISVVIDVAVDKANTALGNFRKSVSDAEGATNKFKAGAGAAMDSVKANAGNLALAGGAALVAFGAKAVTEFQNTALEAGKMSEALGVPVDAMSRLIEVAGDLDIETATLETSLGKMNQTAGRTPQAFDDIGAAIVRNQDGTMNVEATFLAVVDALNAMPDAGQRAAAAQKIFGKGWKDMAELIGQGSDTIIESMEGVSEAQAISPEEVQKARDYKAAMENLQDAMGKVTLAAGEALTPALATIANAVAVITDAVLELEDKTGVSLFDGLLSADFWKFGPTWDAGPGAILKEITGFEGEQPATEIGKVESAFDGVSVAVEDAGETNRWWAQDMRSESQRTADANEAATARIEAAWDSLNEELSDRSSYLDIEDALANVESAYVAAMETADKSLLEQEADARNVERAIIDLRGKVNNYAKEIAGLPPEYATDIQALIDEGAFAEVERRLATLEKIRIARITPETFMPSARVSGYRASGGPVSAGGTYVVGEEGPELLQMGSSSGNVIPNGATVGTSGGSPINIYVSGLTGPAVADDIADKLMALRRRNGKLPWE